MSDYSDRGITASTATLGLTKVGPNSTDVSSVIAQALNASMDILDSAATVVAVPGSATAAGKPRSEEHTSELQSQSNLVCRLLLEKKNQRRSISRSRLT